MSSPRRKKLLERLDQVASGKLPARKMGINESDLRSLRIYFNNRQHSDRTERNADMAKLAQYGPFRLYLQTEADFYHLLAERCYKDVPVMGNVWRNTTFTRKFGVNERNIMDNFGSLHLVEFRDEQSPRSADYDKSRWPGCEGMSVVPVYEMRDRSGTKSFRFIIRPWQQKGEPLTIV